MALDWGGAANKRSPRPKRRKKSRPFYGAGALIAPSNPAFNRERRTGGGTGFLGEIIDFVENAGDIIVDAANDAPELKSRRFRPNRNRGVFRGAGRAPGGIGNNRVGSGGGGGLSSDPYASITDLIGQLMGTLQGDAPSFDYEEILKSSARSINSAYDAEAKAIRRNKRRARNQTRRDRRTMLDMYDALSDSYAGAASQAQRQTRRDKRQMGNIFDQARKGTRKENERLVDYQVEQMKRLGLEEAGKDILPQQTKLASEQLADIASQRSHDVSQTQRLGNINRNYLRQGGQTARLEGTNRAADIQDQLGDYLNTQNDRLTDVTSRRQMDLANLKSTLKAQLNEMQMQYDSDLWERMMDVAGLKFQIDDSRADNILERYGLQTNRRDDQLDYRAAIAALRQEAAESQQADNSELPDLGPLGDIYRMFGSKLGPRNSAEVANVFNSALSRPEMVNRRFRAGGNGDILSMTPEKFADMLEQMGRQANLSPKQLSILRLAAYEHLG